MRLALPCILALVALSACGSDDEFRWPKGDPASHGLDSAAFHEWAASTQERGTEALVVVLNDEIVHEWYAPGRDPENLHYTASMQKGLTGGLGLALLMQDGRITPEERVAKFVHEWRDDPERAPITVRHLASHTSGLEDANEPGVAHEDLRGWKGKFWRRDSAWNPPLISIEKPELLFEPGTDFTYSSPGFAVLSYVLAAAVEETGFANLREYLRQRIFDPIGIQEDDWRMGYDRPVRVHGTEVWGTWGGGSFTPRALARIGRLLLHRGDWRGRQVLAPDVIEEMVAFKEPEAAISTDSPGSPAPGLGWWTNANGAWPGLPRGAFAASGAQQQVLLVVPSFNLVVVRVGDTLLRPGEELDNAQAIRWHLVGPLARVLPEPAGGWSRDFLGTWFDPMSEIRCYARGSDNWPITWAEDGSLFASFGDGWGFEPRTDEKLSLGFSIIPGSPHDPGGRNVRSPTGELRGDGPAGGKSSGILDVDGTLYMWVRNRDNAQIAWSEDRGRTWEWGFRFTESFGSPTFLQFGPGYHRARDEYVYVYSQDGPSAYEPDERLILARAHRDSVTVRESYEFFAGLDPAGAPRWSSELSRRASVFEHPIGVERSEVVYSEEVDRYLLALGMNHQGEWGIFDAPEPWGPWTTVFLTPRWDVGDTHSYRIPTKWIGPGGETLGLVFSGRNRRGRVADGFCLRRVHLRSAGSAIAAGGPTAAR